MKTILRNATNSALLVGLGAAAWLVAPAVSRLLLEGKDNPGQLVAGRPATAVGERAPTPSPGPDEAGDAVVRDALSVLRRRRSVRVDVLQSGRVLGQTIETHGAYLQQGAGDSLRFRLVLQGAAGDRGRRLRLWQVCDGRFVYTDIAWAEPTGDGESISPGRQSVQRVDLTRVRRRIDRDDRVEDEAPPTAGAASARRPAAGGWLSSGGAPMLLGSLLEHFQFSAPRSMVLRNEPVYAVVGHRRRGPLRRLLAPQPDGGDHPPAEAPPGPAAEPDTSGVLAGLPPRLPHHVLLAIGARDRFPRMMEFRSGDDPLSRNGVDEPSLWGRSNAPMLRVDWLKPRFDVAIDEAAFAYSPPDGVDFTDQTAERLGLVRAGGSPRAYNAKP